VPEPKSSESVGSSVASVVTTHGFPVQRSAGTVACAATTVVAIAKIAAKIAARLAVSLRPGIVMRPPLGQRATVDTPATSREFLLPSRVGCWARGGSDSCELAEVRPRDHGLAAYFSATLAFRPTSTRAVRVAQRGDAVAAAWVAPEKEIAGIRLRATMP
jgi:hypothetical protein